MKTVPIRVAWLGEQDCRDCAVRNSALFAGLQEVDFGELHQPIEDIILEPPAVLYRIGERGRVVFTLRRGLVKLVKYLPDGNQNFISGSIFPPPGYNLATMAEIASDVESATRPYWDTQNPEGLTVAEDGTPIFDRFYFAAGTSWTWIGASAVDPTLVKELIPVIRGPLNDEPGTDGFFRQPSLFGRGFGGTRTIDLDISGPDLETIIAVARQANLLAREILPAEEGNQYRPQPGLELGAPELRKIGRAHV